jgi:hypothetical protein
MAACCKIEVGVSVTSPGLQVGKNTNIAYEITTYFCEEIVTNEILIDMLILLAIFGKVSPFLICFHHLLCTIKVLHCCYASAFCRTAVHSKLPSERILQFCGKTEYFANIYTCCYICSQTRQMLL